MVADSNLAPRTTGIKQVAYRSATSKSVGLIRKKLTARVNSVLLASVAETRQNSFIIEADARTTAFTAIGDEHLPKNAGGFPAFFGNTREKGEKMKPYFFDKDGISFARISKARAKSCFRTVEEFMRVHVIFVLMLSV